MEEGSIQKVKRFQGNIISEAELEMSKQNNNKTLTHEGNGNTTSFNLSIVQQL